MPLLLTVPQTTDIPPELISDMKTRRIGFEELASWVEPEFQRPKIINGKVRAFSENLKVNGGVIGGILSLGLLPNDARPWIVDGAHRVRAAIMSKMDTFIADTRIRMYKDFDEMSEEFVKSNSPLVRMKPDDYLRALEVTLPMLSQLRQRCPFIGYASIRRSDTGPLYLLGMSPTLRSWFGSANETPGNSTHAATDLAYQLTPQEVHALSGFLGITFRAWKEDPENFRLWGTLNLVLCMWLYRQLVLKQDDSTRRHATLVPAQFGRCLMALSADRNYCDWLVSRKMNERDRSPCYRRIRELFMRRLAGEQPGQKPKLPQPNWYQGK